LLLQTHATWWQLLVTITIALILSTAIGLERQLHQKAAGLRTHSLVGLGAALFMVTSKYGFDDVTSVGLVNLDPSRVAAQIVSGMGFIGAGLIFVRQNKVRGLTTAASIWLTAAVGMAAGGGLVGPAAFVTVCHFFVAYAYPAIVRVTGLDSSRQHTIRVAYLDGLGALRNIISTCTVRGLSIVAVSTEIRNGAEDGALQRLLSGRESSSGIATATRVVDLELEVEGVLVGNGLIQDLTALDAVLSAQLSGDSE
jgi:putative Mg2+ transporter-C (MgtC) family protein